VFKKPGYYEIVKGTSKGVVGEVGMCPCDECAELLAERKCKVVTMVDAVIVWEDCVRFIGDADVINDAFDSFEKGVKIADLPSWFESAMRTHFRGYMEETREDARAREEFVDGLRAMAMNSGVPASEMN
jgi:hypothetical protein